MAKRMNTFRAKCTTNGKQSTCEARIIDTVNTHGERFVLHRTICDAGRKRTYTVSHHATGLTAGFDESTKTEAVESFLARMQYVDQDSLKAILNRHATIN